MAVTDTPLATGQGNHGSFSRAETRNFMAAIGPDFKAGYADPAPISNADIAPTLAHVMGLELPAKGALKGRVISEALAGGAEVAVRRQTVRSAPGPDGVQTILNLRDGWRRPLFRCRRLCTAKLSGLKDTIKATHSGPNPLSRPNADRGNQ